MSLEQFVEFWKSLGIDEPVDYLEIYEVYFNQDEYFMSIYG